MKIKTKKPIITVGIRIFQDSYSRGNKLSCTVEGTDLKAVVKFLEDILKKYRKELPIFAKRYSTDIPSCRIQLIEREGTKILDTISASFIGLDPNSMIEVITKELNKQK